ncbi:carboxypeptidase-like regulatory domain-containing protein [Turneriella parva]|uniref:Peptidase domain protein n=1 Tax=Turneriella parva (strain ATCC BAA-1111 / DSM 21527 / NCTC 11395 / H) TaxID=869212 RepID=I4BBD5_TURPD|nr:carboxypeptidase-like regulatory domain-containing protein [Turneriella parva]AFM14592.1 peptidase domain protein [Turneriella parva DSM 21527]
MLIALFTLNCFTSEKSLPGVTGSGQISGKVVGPDGTGIASVQIQVSRQDNEQVLQTTSANNGSFSINLNEVKRGTGFNLRFSKSNFKSAARAAVISLPNLKVDIGNVVMFTFGADESLSLRRITGQVYDNFAYKPLIGANVTTTDAAGQVLVVSTNENGRFILESNYFPLPSDEEKQVMRDNGISEMDIQALSTFAIGVYKADYITRTDIVAVITAEENPIRNNPVRLYQKFGSIYGHITEDTLGTALNNVSATLTNSNNQQLTCNSGGPYDANSSAPYEPLAAGLYCPDMDDDFNTNQNGANGGGFKIKDQFLLVGTRYPVTLSKTSAACTARTAATTNCYRTKTTYADVLLTGNNAIAGAATALMWDSWIHGTVTAGSGVLVKLYNSSNTYITEVTTNASGQFLFDHASILRNQQYKMTFEKSGYYSRLIGLSAPNDPALITITIAGANNAGAVTMTALPPPTHCVMGTVTDYWSTLPVDGATVAIFDGGWRTATTGPAAASGGFPALSNGQFIIQGNFGNTAVNAFDVEISRTGYTGETQVGKQTFKFTHSGIAACPGTPFNLDTQLACGASGVGPTGGSNCTNQLRLYPIGIYAVINGGSKYFRNQTKQTYEKFLTEKTGLTISGRTGDLIRTSSLPQKTYDFDGIYLHFDDTPRILPNVPEGKWSNHVPVNPNGSSPAANGVLTEGIGADSRTNAWDLKNYVYYHFYAAQPGSYTIETTGSTDTHITLTAQTGANLGSDDDSGTGSNGRIGPINLLRGWYYVKVRGKNDNVFGFFDVRVTGPAQVQSNYNTMLSPTATYATNCGTNNGNLVVSWYDATGHLLYVAGPGERPSVDLNECSANATIDMHGPIGDIIRGRFDGKLRPIAAAGAAANVSTGTFRGFFNILRTE